MNHLLPLFRKTAQRLFQPKMFQNYRMQTANQPPEALLHGLAVTHDQRRSLADQRLIIGCLSQQIGLRTNTGQVLAQVIVQLTSQIGAFLFL